ncbi:hypothetical protein HJC23_007581 [Cyclotella cryptica]|uniref:Uncharacterized protein n=1 Tax=Cyclotella cryptica TaxID=29204 RepID=A0ABD3QRJ3_9STRA
MTQAKCMRNATAVGPGTMPASTGHCRTATQTANIKRSEHLCAPQQCAPTTETKIRHQLLDNGTGKTRAISYHHLHDTPGRTDAERRKNEELSAAYDAIAHRMAVGHSIHDAGKPRRDRSCNDVDTSYHPQRVDLTMVHTRSHVLRL